MTAWQPLYSFQPDREAPKHVAMFVQPGRPAGVHNGPGLCGGHKFES